MSWNSLLSCPTTPYLPLRRRSLDKPAEPLASSSPVVLHELPKRSKRPTYAFANTPTNHWQRQHVRFAFSNAWDILQQRPVHYQVAPEPESVAQINSRAVKKGYAELSLCDATEALAGFFRPSFVRKYHERLHDPRRPVLAEGVPQHIRLIKTEGDVGDINLVGTLLPVAAILNSLLRANGRVDLQVVVQHQTSSGDFALGAELREAERTRQSVGRLRPPCAMDHALVLVSRRGFTQTGFSIIEEQCHLVIVEEKRAHYIKPSERYLDKEGQLGENMRIHLPQLLMYSKEFGCGRLIVSDHLSAIALRVDVNKIDPRDPNLPALPIAFQKLDHEPGDATRPFDPAKPTFRHALCMLALEALVDMKVLDKKLFPIKPDAQGNQPHLRGAAERVAKEGFAIEQLFQVVDRVYDVQLGKWAAGEGRRPNKPSGYDKRRRRATE